MLWYWGQAFTLVSFLTGIYNLLKKRKNLGFMQIFFSPLLFIHSFLFSMHRDWVDGNETPQDFFVRMIKIMDFRSVLIVCGFITLLVLFILTFKKKKSKMWVVLTFY